MGNLCDPGPKKAQKNLLYLSYTTCDEMINVCFNCVCMNYTGEDGAKSSVFSQITHIIKHITICEVSPYETIIQKCVCKRLFEDTSEMSHFHYNPLRPSERASAQVSAVQ